MFTFTKRNNNRQQVRDPNTNSYYSISPVSSYATSTMKEPPPPPVKKSTGMLWGKPTWYMLHCLAEKIKPEHFPRLRMELLNIILRICNNLPCPDCANHATAYMNGINFDNIQTKGQLKLMLFQFHNSVNVKKQFSVFEYKDLDSTYQNMSMVNVINNFFHHFLKPTYSGRMGTYNFHRTRAVRDLKEWLRMNISYFEP